MKTKKAYEREGARNKGFQEAEGAREVLTSIVS